MPADAIHSQDMRTRGGIGKVIDSPELRERKRRRNHSRSIRRGRNLAKRSLVQRRESAIHKCNLQQRMKAINERIAFKMDKALLSLTDAELQARYAAH